MGPIDTVLILGAGRIGSAVAYLLKQAFIGGHREIPVPQVVMLDTSIEALGNPLLEHMDQLISIDPSGFARHVEATIDEYKPKLLVNALPHQLNEAIHHIVTDARVNYLDLTEDVEDTRRLSNMTSFKDLEGVTLLPQQGLAPGLVNILASWLVKQHQGEDLKELRLRVGALPQVARGKLGYATTWSVDGLINEYLNPSIELVQGKSTVFASMTGYEQVSFRGTQLEAFRTSGGAGSLITTLADKVPSVNYKTLRWPGHHDAVMFLMDELKLDRELLKTIFKRSIPSRVADCVYMMVSLDVELENCSIATYEMGRRYVGLQSGKHRLDAIQVVTALGAVGVIELLLEGKLPTGLVTHDMIDYMSFEQTESGRLLNRVTDTYLNGAV